MENWPLAQTKTWERMLAKRRIEGDCWIWTGEVRGRGYGAIKITGLSFRTHRLSYELHKGPIPAGKYVCHTCDVPLCFNPDHLWVGTTDENMADMVRKGRSCHGERHPRTLLLEVAAREIRESHAAFVRSMEAKYGVPRSNIQNIISGKSWKHLRISTEGLPIPSEE